MLARSVNYYMCSKLECDFVPSFLSHLNLGGTTPRIIPSKLRGEALNAILVHPNEGVRLTKMQVGEPTEADSPTRQPTNKLFNVFQPAHQPHSEQSPKA